VVCFAKRGIGLSATRASGPQNLNVSEAFDFPAQCMPDCGDSLLQAGEQCDDGNAAAFDGCSAGCRAETLLSIYGIAMGGSASVTVDGVLVTVPTSTGQSAAQVAAALAARSGDPVLAAAASQRRRAASSVTGSVSAFTLGDPGLSQQRPCPCQTSRPPEACSPLPR
jgi:cysteine-rich repeat protein